MKAFDTLGILAVVSVILTLLLLGVAGHNSFAKTMGGTINYTQEPGYRVVTMSWKDSNLWVLYENDTEYFYKEYSNYGIVNGAVKMQKVKVENGK